MALVRTSVVQRVEGLMTSPVDGDLVILNMVKNNYVALDSIGKRIWDLLAQPLEISELCRILGEQFAGEPEQIASDVLTFLTDIEGDGLIRVAAR